jgi:hypothetical protein
MISGLCRGVNEVFILLGCYVVVSGSCLTFEDGTDRLSYNVGK